MQRVTIPRKLVMLGVGGLLTIAGLGGVASHAAHASSVRATAPTATASTDTDGAGGPDVQQQVGDQSTAADAAESAAPEAEWGE